MIFVLQVTLNGRPGLAVSGGLSTSSSSSSSQNTTLTSVEFYDVTSGHWVSLPGLRAGRHSHNMMVDHGRLRVLGGSQAGDQAGVLRDMETFDGKRWDRLVLIFPVNFLSLQVDQRQERPEDRQEGILSG